MGRKRRSGNLSRTLNDDNSSKSRVSNQGKGQEITGVSLPIEGTIKGWEFGEGVRIACANVKGNYYAIQGECPRCAFDLWKGDLITEDNQAFDDVPRVACPTCATTFSLRTGKHGPPLKRTGLQGFVAGLTKSATANDSYKDAKAHQVTVEEETSKVYCRL